MVRVEVKENGLVEVAFPNADIIETDKGPMMGFTCPPQSALYVGGAIIHAAYTASEDLLDGEIDDEDDDDE